MAVAELHPPRASNGPRLSNASQTSINSEATSMSWVACVDSIKDRQSVRKRSLQVPHTNGDRSSNRGSILSVAMSTVASRKSANALAGLASGNTSRRGRNMLGVMHKQVQKTMHNQGPKQKLSMGSSRQEVEEFWELILGKLTPFRKFCLQVVTAFWFDGMIATVVLCNAMIMALESEVEALGPYIYMLELIFLGIYSVEVVMRVYVFRSLVFNSKANLLDMTVVLLGWITDVAIPIAIGGTLSEDETLEGIGSGVVLLKLLRALRVLRCVRLIAFFDGLWLVVHSFFFCLRPLLWTCIFISVVIFVFTIFAVELIGNGSEFQDAETRVHFIRTVPAFVTLFQLMTLDEWRGVIQPICDAQGWAYLFFFFFICISALALMNLVTAVVVENGMRRIEQDDDYKGQVLEREQVAEVGKIRELFKYFKVDEDGKPALEAAVSAEDLLAVKGSWAALERILDTLGIDQAEDMKRLMKLIDTDGDGELSLEECLDGLLQLRSVSEDKYRTALIQSMDSQEAKFSVLERVLGTMPEAMSGKLENIYRIVRGLEQHLGAAPSDDRGSRKVGGSNLEKEDMQPEGFHLQPCPGSSELLREFHDFKAQVDAQLDHQDDAIRKLLSFTSRLDQLDMAGALDEGPHKTKEAMQRQKHKSSTAELPSDSLRRAADDSLTAAEELGFMPDVPDVPEFIPLPMSLPVEMERPPSAAQEAWFQVPGALETEAERR